MQLFQAQTREEREAIHQQANQIRKDEASRKNVVIPLQFETDKIVKTGVATKVKHPYELKQGMYSGKSCQ